MRCRAMRDGVNEARETSRDSGETDQPESMLVNVCNNLGSLAELKMMVTQRSNFVGL